MFRATFSCLLLFALSHNIWGQFPGYNLPCFKDLCAKPCADLGKEIQYLNVTVSNWPIQPSSQMVTLNVTIQPTTNLTDVGVFLEVFGVLKSSETPVHCVVTDYLCKSDDPNRWENKICPIPAFTPTTYGWHWGNEDVEEMLSIAVSGNATFKMTSFDKRLLACVSLTLTKDTQGDFSSANAYEKKTKRLFRPLEGCNW